MTSWGVRHTRTLPSALSNWDRNSSDQTRFLKSSRFQPICSRTQQRFCSRCRVVSKGTRVSLLLPYAIIAKYSCTALTLIGAVI
ncbi:hypothetical protein AVEN_100437-1 [Araneus ventricosus]|uniref:Uncharacterized protein n=1 Tax=Araneus ventricosus TaxID=182803 RepID=A0A4Y2D0M1_ARAVE|nr:hypothetical protein AVEN_100437-1 [Araneus ventricosus]